MAWGWCVPCVDVGAGRPWPLGRLVPRARAARARGCARVALPRPQQSPAAASSTGQRQPRKGWCAGGSPHPAVPMHGAHRPNRTRAACACVGSPSASCQKELCSGGSQDLRRPQGGKLELGGGELSATVTATATATFGRAAREARCATPGTAPSTFVPLALLVPAALFSRVKARSFRC